MMWILYGVGASSLLLLLLAVVRDWFSVGVICMAVILAVFITGMLHYQRVDERQQDRATNAYMTKHCTVIGQRQFHLLQGLYQRQGQTTHDATQQASEKVIVDNWC